MYLCNMYSKRILEKKRKSVFKLDATSDRYRVCPYDGVEFMADNRKRIYCDDYCADEFHNRSKRQKAEDKDNEQTLTLEKVEVQPDKHQIQSLSEPVDNVTPNIGLLNSWGITSDSGHKFHVEWMQEQGYDFLAYSATDTLHNIDPTLKSKYIQVGEFLLYRVDYSHILIKKTK